MLRRCLLLGCLVCLSFFQPVKGWAQKIPSAIGADPVPDRLYPAFLGAPDVPSHGSRLNAVIYVAAGIGPHPTALLLHGFPGDEQNMDLAYSMRRAGWNVLFPHYRGSWGSDGSFSFAHAIEDTQAAVEFLRDPRNDSKYRIDPRTVVLVGHSMGGFMASYVASRDPSIAAIAMIAAWDIGPDMLIPISGVDLDSFRDDVLRLKGATPEELLAEGKRNAAEWNYLNDAPGLKARPVLVVETGDTNIANNKAMCDALRKAGNRRVTETYIPSDHAFSGRRVALQAALLNWLQTLTAPKPQ